MAVEGGGGAAEKIRCEEVGGSGRMSYLFEYYSGGFAAGVIRLTLCIGAFYRRFS